MASLLCERRDHSNSPHLNITNSVSTNDQTVIKPTIAAPQQTHFAVLVIGGGQAGLSASYLLKERGIDHIVFEKNRLAESWRSKRWDSFCLVTPNWQCQLPGHPYDGPDPHGFMVKREILSYLDGFARKTNGSVREGVELLAVEREKDLFLVTTSAGRFLADAVFLATSLYGDPYRPRCAERAPDSVAQVHSTE